MLTRNFYESITNTMGPKTMRSLELAVGDGTGTYSEPWGLHDLYHRLGNCELTFPWQRHVSVSVQMTNVSHHCPPTTAAITWPGSRTYVVYAPAMTFAPSQLSWLHCVLLSFKKKKKKWKGTRYVSRKCAPGQGEKKFGVEKAEQVLLVARQDVMTLWPMPTGGYWVLKLRIRESGIQGIRLNCETDSLNDTSPDRSIRAVCPVIIWKSVRFRCVPKI